MSRDRLEGNIVIETAYISQLHEKEERRCRVLQAGHDRMRRKPDQGAKPNQAEQYLEHAAKKYNGRDLGRDGGSPVHMR